MTRAQTLIVHSLLLIGTFVMAFPFAWMLLTSLKHSSDVLDPAVLAPPLRHFAMVDGGGGKQKELLVDILRTTPEGVEVKHRAGDSMGKIEMVPPSKIESRRLQTNNYSAIWNRGGGLTFSRFMVNSIVVAGLATIGQLITSLLAAYAFTFMEFPLKGFLFSLLLGTMMVPQQVLLVPDFLIIRNLGWYNTYWALFLPWTAGVFGIFMLRQFFLSMPKDLWEAAMMDGCGRGTFLWRILVPLSIPPLVTIGIFSFLTSWNSLIWPLVVTDKPEFYTLQVGLASFTNEAGTRWEQLMAASSISILPLVVMYFMAQRQFIEGIAKTGIKG